MLCSEVLCIRRLQIVWTYRIKITSETVATSCCLLIAYSSAGGSDYIMFAFRGLRPAQIYRIALQRRISALEGAKVFLCVADHYEPKWQSPPASLATERVERWISDYPKMAAGICDSRGRSPQHTFFYPAEEYEP